MDDHDVLKTVSNITSVIKGAGTEAKPHAPNCAGCAALRQCHGCNSTINEADRCTMGACANCCSKMHPTFCKELTK